jgi:hypothetical protein
VTVRDWVVTYRPRPRAAVVVWAVIVDVPAEVGHDDVTAALEAWSRWPAWQARVGIGAVLTVRARRASDDGQVTDERFNVERLTWAALAPNRKRIGLDVDGRLYAAVSRAARSNGQSIAAWCTGALASAAGVDLAALPPLEPVAAGFEDVPLEGLAL